MTKNCTKFYEMTCDLNTPGTRVGPGFRDQTLAIKSSKNTAKSVFFCKKYKLEEEMIYFFDILSSYSKIFGQTKYQLPEYPRSGLKEISVEEGRRESGSQC